MNLCTKSVEQYIHNLKSLESIIFEWQKCQGVKSEKKCKKHGI